MTPGIIVALLLASMLAVSFQAPIAAQGVSCASFASRAAAQAALAANPTVAAMLDTDHDGRACEDILDPEPGDGQGGAAGTGLTGADIDCADLASQPIAQRILERNPSDPFNLDPNGDGIACSSLPGVPPTEQLAIRPVTDAGARTRPAKTSLLPGDTSQPNMSRLKMNLIAAAADIDAFWTEGYDDPGTTYVSPEVRTFQQTRATRCGPAQTGIGPGYCSLDQTIYIDVPIIRQIDFFHDPFVMRVILAHEWGHHIQYLSGYQAAADPNQRGEVYSLQAELDADCLAGVWAHHAKDTGEATEDDLLKAMNLAYMIGDDPGSSLLAPDAHGTGQMRLGAFTIGLNSGKPRLCEREILTLTGE
jgi:predicted metalloprotease